MNNTYWPNSFLQIKNRKIRAEFLVPEDISLADLYTYWKNHNTFTIDSLARHYIALNRCYVITFDDWELKEFLSDSPKLFQLLLNSVSEAIIQIKLEREKKLKDPS